MKTQIITILLAAMLTMTGCSLRDAVPDNLKNKWDKIQAVLNETDEPAENGDSAETEKPDEPVKPGEIGEPETPVEQPEVNEPENVPEPAEPEPDTDYFVYYAPVVDELFRLVSGDYDENNLPEGGLGLQEAGGWSDSNPMLWESGFIVQDFSGDGIPELLIGAENNGMIYALYTIADDAVHLLAEGTYRNMYYLTADGLFLNQGSGGAIYSIIGTYELEANGSTLTCRDFWFTHEKDGNFEDIRCWHNTTGEMNPAVSEELAMTLDEFWEMEVDLTDSTVTLDVTTFGEYGGLEKPEYAENPTVSAVYGNDYTGEYDSFAADYTDYAVDVVFTTDATVRNFKVLALTLNEITDDGEVSFFFEELYTYGELTPDKGLGVKMSLPETIPFYGISYTDGTGADRVFSVNLSGFDGSVQLAEIGGVG